MDYADFRSDTVTQPSPAMRDAMANAPVGDDVYGEDPSIERLEREVATRLGKESAVFVPSGTMANQIAILAHTERGDEIFIHEDSHAYFYEAGAAAMWAGATFSLLTGEYGWFDVEALQAKLRGENIHHPRPRLIILENTHNRGGGSAIATALIRPLSVFAWDQGLHVHLDGARLYNAAIALGESVTDLSGCADSVSLCLSKGLGAPVGSVLAGTTSFIDRARRYRKALGGGMRQAGVLAAAGLVALTEGPALLTRDHARAHQIRSDLQALGYTLRVPPVPTNMVLIHLATAEATALQLREHGVLSTTMGPNLLRLVTHRDQTDADVDRVLSAFRRLAR